MDKVVRYFPPVEDAEEKKQNEVVYKVKIKKKPWGRKQEDRREKSKNIANKKKSNRPPISKQHLEKHSRGEGMSKRGVRTGIHKMRLDTHEGNVRFAHEQAARNEVLLTEQAGYLEADEGESTLQFTQRQIADSLDITSASKNFELNLRDFGPYRNAYTRNGRHLLLGGKKGHVAAFDWVTKKLHCEINVMESVHDVCWLHNETMFAVAQKEWLYMYDNEGTELHCLKKLYRVSRMEFLPYHFLLASASEQGYLSWLDVSIGEIVAQFNTKLGRLTMLTQNPYNATLCVGHAKGVVSMWAPNTREPLAKILCHKACMTAIHVDPKGTYMATAATDRTVKVWDVRKLEGPLQTYIVRSTPSNVAFSQKNMLAVSMENVVEVYRDCVRESAEKAYLRHRFNQTVAKFEFCPYEDVLGVGTQWGFSSLIIPGAGEANFDAFEANPFQTKSQRREAEVKALLEKIQPDLITLDPTKITDVDVPTLRDKVEAKKKLLYVKPPKVNYEPRKKMKGRGGTANIARNKKIVRDLAKKEFIKNNKALLEETIGKMRVKKKKSSISF